MKQYLRFCFLYNTAETADGTVSFVFSCFLVCFVLLCSVSRLVNDNKYPVQHHEPERTGSLKIRKVWLLGSDVMGLQVSRHRI